jgi:hypothetical protein
MALPTEDGINVPTIPSAEDGEEDDLPLLEVSKSQSSGLV